MSIITLLTDFGLKDSYVAAMKGMILNVCSDITIIDITHDSDFFDVPSAAFILYNSYFTFPEDTVHVCVVDPGVGTDRDVLVIQDSGHWFIGPDNGIFSLILQKPYPLMREILRTPFFTFDKGIGPSSSGSADRASEKAGLPSSETMIWRLKRDSFENSVSKTFHGRDIFAPAGALLCCPERREILLSEHFEFLGKDNSCISGTGQSLFEGNAVFLSQILKEQDSSAGSSFSGRAVHIDTFGNIVTDIFADHYPDGVSVSILNLGGALREFPFLPSYQEAEEGSAFLYRGSAGLLEIGINKGSAAERLNIRRGDRLEIRFS